IGGANRRMELEPAPAPGGQRATPLPILFGSSGGSAALPGLLDSLLASTGVRAISGGAQGKMAVQAPPEGLVPGAAVGVGVVEGDLDLTAVGTVTYREGNEVLCFGHPLFGAGSVSLPLTTAYVHTILSSSLISNKMASAGDVVGALTEDRNYAIRGAMG